MFIRNRIICLVFATVFAISATPATSGLRQTLPAHFTAFAVSPGGPLTSAVAGQLDITITRWSTEGETERFLAALKKGQDSLIEEFQDVEAVGRIQSPGTLGYDLRYASHEDLGDGLQRIVLATDRPMSFYETVNRPLSSDYPFTYIELRVNSEGRGEGKLSIASAMSTNRKGTMIQVYNFDTQPIQLNEVRRVDR
jgi:hypothetical protein